EKRLSAITETAPDAIVCIKPGDIAYLWNRKAEEMFGYTAEEVVGKEAHPRMVPENKIKEARAGLETFFKTGEGPLVGKTVELTAHRRDNSEFPVELSVSAMRIKDEWHSTAIIRDITERKKAEEELAKHVDELERYMKATVQREFRVKELRDENERLKAKLKEMGKG
ncbi:MAG: PAS domain S-box protein, partial [Deltaproteobacteria bacterium]|nr:PAS domain S-box protein [Deltaproteobacteria bacterium]